MKIFPCERKLRYLGYHMLSPLSHLCDLYLNGLLQIRECNRFWHLRGTEHFVFLYATFKRAFRERKNRASFPFGGSSR